jgi:hypothetical protein
MAIFKNIFSMLSIFPLYIDLYCTCQSVICLSGTHRGGTRASNSVKSTPCHHNRRRPKKKRNLRTSERCWYITGQSWNAHTPTQHLKAFLHTKTDIFRTWQKHILITVIFYCRAVVNKDHYMLVTFVFLKVHKIENFFGSDFEFCVISLLVMLEFSLVWD